ncbi:hypothetical protein F5I97DRAFT_231408 [Phlebopus sp. FC_14]|nr:hypothetical protein F5I97DRAFT_231408 [Phlebopus sp. FC_14]
MSYGYGAPPGYGGYGGGPGGFTAGVPRGPPPGADPEAWHWFNTVDNDRSQAITVNELRSALMNGNGTAFDLDTIKLLMNIFDRNRSGTIGYSEFEGLWKYIKDWQRAFSHFDRDRSGSINETELSNALSQFGYRLNPLLIRLVQEKYCHQASSAGGYHAGRPAGITFDRFVRACVAIKQATEAFQALDYQGTGVVQIDYDKFMQTVLELP